MLKMVVCIKQVPMVSELPWDPKTGTLKRDLAEGMINPACRAALDAAVRIRESEGGEIVAMTMGPPMAEEVLREAIALGADRGVLLCDRRLAGADTLATSYTLARALRRSCPDFDLILCGFATSDSETAQVGPQLAEALGIPGSPMWTRSS
jgi:electron transfer flavoprotein beta subunit